MIPATKVKGNPTDTPYYWMTAEQKEQHLILCHKNWRCPYSHSAQCNKTERWTGWKIPAKTIRAFDSTLTFVKGCNIYRALLLKEIVREHKRKPNFKPCQLAMDAFVKQVRVGSHQEWIETDDKGHGFHRIVKEYTTHFHDCLSGKDWLKEHHKDKYPEPGIELSIDGERSISLNGDFKKGMIKEWVKANKGVA